MALSAAHHSLVEDHLPLAARLSRVYRGRGVEDDDLLQVARLALVKAVQRYDTARGDFAPFAASTIRGELKRHFRDRAWTVRPPRRLQELQARIAAETSSGSPAAAELSTRLGVPLADVREAMAVRSCFTSDRLEDALGTAGHVDHGFEQVDAWSTVGTLRASLSDDDRRLLAWRFVDELPQREIAERLGISQMQVSRRLSTLLERMRREVTPDAA